MKRFSMLLSVVGFGWMVSATASQSLVATKVAQEPDIDGRSDEAVWSAAKPVITHDRVAGIDITLKAVYTEDSIFMLVTFPDPSESRDHKTMIWNADQQYYRTGNNREDTFVIKWSMEPIPVDLSISSDESYRADIWFWKAHRTDPSGYADDKYHLYSNTQLPDGDMVISKLGHVFYLSRSGDEGNAAYRDIVYEQYAADRLPKYERVTPTGSRADVRAKGGWHDGAWSVEFARRLKTGHIDDLELDPRGFYQFGVSRYEVAGRPADPDLDQPNYSAGDISEDLTLRFE